MKYIFSVIPGFEDISAKEIEEKSRINTKKFTIQSIIIPGKLVGDTEISISNIFFSVIELFHYVTDFEFKDIEDIIKNIKKMNIYGIEQVENFRITAHIMGNSNIKRAEIEKKIGEYIFEKYKRPVSLKNAELEIVFEIFGNLCIIMSRYKNENNIKIKNPFKHIVGTKQEIAYCLCRLIDTENKKIKMLDPFTGSGSIPIAFALAHPNAEIIGCDLSEKYLEGAKENAKAASVSERITFIKMDSTKLEEKFEKDYFDCIIADPPYGMKMKWTNPIKLYQDFLESSSKVLKKKGTIVIMTTRAEGFRHVLYRDKRYILEEERVIGKGTPRQHVFVLKKLT